MTEPQATQTHPWDYAVIGVLVSLVLTVAIAALGGYLLLQGEISSGGSRVLPEALRLPGLLMLMFNGILTAGIVAASRKWAARRGWPRAAKGALWTSMLTAALNAFVVLVFAIDVRRRMP